MNRKQTIIKQYQRQFAIHVLISAIITLYAGFHLRRGSILLFIFLVINIIFQWTTLKGYKKKIHLNEIDDIPEAEFWDNAHSGLKKGMTYFIVWLIIISCISRLISILSRRPAWEYTSNVRKWSQENSNYNLLPAQIPEDAENIWYYCTEYPAFVTNIKKIWLRFEINDEKKDAIVKDLEQKAIKIYASCTDSIADNHIMFQNEPDDIREHASDYDMYILSECEYYSIGAVVGKEKNDICYFCAPVF